MNWDIYERRLGVAGETTRERLLSSAARNLLAHEKVHPSCKEFKKGKKKISLLTRTTANGYEHIFIVLPEQRVSLNIGDIVSYGNDWFLVTEHYFDDVHVERGLMRQCNHVFRFQNGTPDIIEVHGIVVNPYSRSSISGKIVEEPFNKLTFILPKNSDTEKIYLGKRFIVEVGYNHKGERQPFVYKAVMVGSETDHYDDGGLLTVNLEYTPVEEDDNPDEMIANFIPKATDEPVRDSAYYRIEGADTIRVGIETRVYSAVFVSASGDESDALNGDWSVDASELSGLPCSHAVQDGKISITVGGGLAAVGKHITVLYHAQNGSEYKLRVKVVGLY